MSQLKEFQDRKLNEYREKFLPYPNDDEKTYRNGYDGQSKYIFQNGTFAKEVEDFFTSALRQQLDLVGEMITDEFTIIEREVGDGFGVPVLHFNGETINNNDEFKSKIQSLIKGN